MSALPLRAFLVMVCLARVPDHGESSPAVIAFEPDPQWLLPDGTVAVGAVAISNRFAAAFGVAFHSGQRYRVQSKPDIANPIWTDTGPPIEATGTNTSTLYSTRNGNPRFHRVLPVP